MIRVHFDKEEEWCEFEPASYLAWLSADFLSEIASEIGSAPLSDFVRQPSHPAQWFSCRAGLKAIEALLAFFEGPDDFLSRRPAARGIRRRVRELGRWGYTALITEELGEMHERLEWASSQGARFYLSNDY